MDTDGNGTIDDVELEAARQAWLGPAAELLRVALDGRAVALNPLVSLDLAGERRVTARPLVAELATWVPLTRAAHTLTLTPGPHGPRGGEPGVRGALASPWPSPLED